MIFATGFFEIWFALIFFLMWSIMYQILVLDFHYTPESGCRMVTAIHGSTVTLLSAIAWHGGPNPFVQNTGGANTFMQKFALTVSLGYFIFDMAWCMYYQTEGYTMIAHHVISIIVLSRVLMRDRGGAEAVVGLFCMEISNPFLQTRWFVRTAGYKDTMYYTMAECTFILLFIFFRLVLGSILCYCITISPDNDLETKLSAITLYALSWVFMAFITRYIIVKYIFRTNLHRTRSVLPTKTSRGMGNDRISISSPNTSTSMYGPGSSDKPVSASVPNTSSHKEKVQ